MTLDFNKSNGLIPVIIQDDTTLNVLMLGYMDEVAYNKTIRDRVVTFFSRTKNRLWTKGETSGNFLIVKSIYHDCDNDSLLIKVTAQGPVCHTGNTSCFNNETAKGIIYKLEQTIHQRIDANTEKSYTNQLYNKGINKIAQKVGEEAIELVIEAKDNNNDLFKGEAADLLYHFLILLKAKNINFSDVEEVLELRSRQ